MSIHTLVDYRVVVAGKRTGSGLPIRWPEASLLKGGRDVGLFEILAFEEERLTSNFGKGIGKAIAEIQPGGVAALTEIEEGLSREVRLLDGDGFDDDAGPSKKNIALAARVESKLTFNDNRKLNEVCGADQAMIGRVDQSGVKFFFRFPKKDG